MLRWVGFFIPAFASLLLASCGAREAGERVPPRPGVAVSNPVPSPENASEWRSIWDGKSWIVAWKQSGISLNHENVREAVLRAVDTNLDKALSLEMRWALTGRLSLETLIPPASLQTEGLRGFAFVRFRQDSPFWDPFLAQFSRMPRGGLSAFENVQWETLHSMPEALWVEPDLQSELFEYTLPPEVASNTDGLEHLRWIRADVAWEKAVGSDGLPHYEYGKRSEGLNWTNVAVLDTGVDWKHPDLWDEDATLNHIFTNSRDPVDCVDNDKNGYIDDVHGIDASIEMEAWNAAALKSCKKSPPEPPNPGSAEVPGPGNPCSSGLSPAAEDKCSHGTHVAGIIAAKHGSEGATAGVCPSCRIVPVRVSSLHLENKLPWTKRIEDSSQIRGLSYVMSLVDANGLPFVRILNMSLGKYFVSRSLAYMFRRLLASDMLVVAAAGNDDTDTPNYPAAYDPVLSVCATSTDGDRGRYAKAGFSNFGTWVDICAPGHKITSTEPGSRSGPKSGTSMASPVVAGAAGYLKSVFPNASAQEISDMLERYSNAAVLYNFADGETTIPEGASKVNKRNYLYHGNFPDGTQFYMLGSGFLDLAAAITKGKECWASNTALCQSYAFQNRIRKLQSQLDGGCVLGSVSRGPSGGATTSMPAMVLALLAVLRGMGLARRR